MAAAVVVGGIGAHAGAGHSVLAEADARSDSTLFKGSILLVDVEFVGLRVVRDQNVGPAIGGVIKDRNSEAFRTWIVESGFLRGVFAFAIAHGMPNANPGSLVGLRSAARLRRSI